MASITIRNLDEQTKARLRVRAAHHKRSMEDEARNILRTALSTTEVARGNLAEVIRRRFEPLGGVELRLPVREPMRRRRARDPRLECRIPGRTRRRPFYLTVDDRTPARPLCTAAIPEGSELVAGGGAPSDTTGSGRSLTCTPAGVPAAALLLRRTTRSIKVPHIRSMDPTLALSRVRPSHISCSTSKV